MKSAIRRRAALGALLAGSTVRAAVAQTGARATARLIVPYAPGGTNDLTARLIAPRAGERLGQNWVVENRSGASGAIGAEFVARSAPDGLTVLYSNEVHLMLSYVQRSVPWDARTDFTPIVRTVAIPYVMIGPASAPTRDLAALLDAMRRNASAYSFAGSTLGSIGQLGAAALGLKLGIEAQVIAYRGTGPALNDVVAGNVPLFIAPLGPALPLIREGRVRCYATTAAARVSQLPEVPTLVEAGFPDIVFEGWCGAWGPKGLPGDVVARLREAIITGINDPEALARMRDLGLIALNEGTADFVRIIEAEAARNAALVAAAGIRPE
ncbi:Bug family tripartite tricarboxylate transporter substrate binding protein [Roseomonas sp. CCTCC AB2023176]|uniref:Bug family tripartite tricarboxylate transporter substrate binding protein n=1 Tax=Roseomonas sp. CCTCC AB2023176 TaxID=3342640 RepID=UPI0035D7F846